MFRNILTSIANSSAVQEYIRSPIPGSTENSSSPWNPPSPDADDGGSYFASFTSPYRATSPLREIPPPQPQHKIVTEISGSSKRKEVDAYDVFQRCESLILHGVLDKAISPVKYNLILHVPGSDKLFSLCRTDSEEEAQNDFILFKECLIPLIKIDTHICNTKQLEEISAVIRKNPGWTASHLIASMDFYTYLAKDQAIKNLINFQEGVELKTPLHIAVEAGKINTINALLKLNAQIDVTDIHGNNIIHSAVAKPDSSPAILKLLLNEAEKKSPMLKDLLNNEGCTPLHIATEQNSEELVKLLLQLGVNMNIPHNESFPIHMAVKNKSECAIKEINKMGVDQLQLKDLKNGGTPLHWAETPETVKLLLDLGCDPNIVNKQGQSALHTAARRGDLRSTLLLLGHQCFPDLQDKEGETALHVASRLCSKSVIKALIVFQADLNITNNRGYTPRHLVCTSGRDDSDEALFFLDRVGAVRCLQSTQGCTSGCRVLPPSPTRSPTDPEPNNGKSPINCTLATTENDSMNDALSAFGVLGLTQRQSMQNVDVNDSEAPTKSKVRRSDPALNHTVGGRLLCLDGGGIRGLVLTQILLCIEEVVGAPIATLFDWISGTSTGGILGLGLACGKSVMELQALYMRLKDEIFTGSKPYSASVMEDFLKKEFGEFKKMSDIHRPRVMISATLVDTRPADFHFFRNYMSPASILSRSAEEDPGLNEYVWQVAKWTGAAPSYFKLDGSRYIDGGLMSNNPTQDALTELVQFSSAMKSVGDANSQDIQIPNCVVSLGCGIQPKVPCDPKHMDICVPKGIFDAISTFSKLPAFVSLLVDQATLSEGQIVERSRAWCSAIGVPFFRFSPQCPVFVDLDEVSDEILIDLMWVTRAYLHTNRTKLIELKNILLDCAPGSHDGMDINLSTLSLIK